VERLIDVVSKEFEKVEPKLSKFFRNRRFIKVRPMTWRAQNFREVLPDHILVETLLEMYANRHLRGNTILDASYCNEAVEIRDLARGVLEGHYTALNFVEAINAG